MDSSLHLPIYGGEGRKPVFNCDYGRLLTHSRLERSLDTEIIRQGKEYKLMNSLDPEYRKRNRMSVKEVGSQGSRGGVPVLEEEQEGGVGPVLAEQGIYSEGVHAPILEEGETAGNIAEDNAEKVGEIMRDLGISEDGQEDA